MAKKEKPEKSGVAAPAGAAAGKREAPTGATPEKREAPTPPKKKVGKLAPKNKSRLPRKQKKAQKKAAAKQGG